MSIYFAIFAVAVLIFVTGYVLGEDQCYRSRRNEELRKIDERRDLRSQITALERINLLQRISHG